MPGHQRQRPGGGALYRHHPERLRQDRRHHQDVERGHRGGSEAVVQPPGECRPARQPSRAVDGLVVEAEVLAGRFFPPPHGVDVAAVERPDEGGEPLSP